MRPNGTLVGTHWGPISAIGPQPRRRHEDEVWVGTPTRPWGSRRLPRTLLAGDGRRVLFREMLRRAEGVPVEFPGGEIGVVAEVVFSGIGHDFWPVELVVTLPEERERRRVPVAAVQRIDIQDPRIVAGAGSRRPQPAAVRHSRRRHGVAATRRLMRRQRRRPVFAGRG